MSPAELAPIIRTLEVINHDLRDPHDTHAVFRAQARASNLLLRLQREERDYEDSLARQYPEEFNAREQAEADNRDLEARQAEFERRDYEETSRTPR